MYILYFLGIDSEAVFDLYMITISMVTLVYSYYVFRKIDLISKPKSNRFFIVLNIVVGSSLLGDLAHLFMELNHIPSIVFWPLAILPLVFYGLSLPFLILFYKSAKEIPHKHKNVLFFLLLMTIIPPWLIFFI